MRRAASATTQTAIARAVKGVRAAGIEVGKVEVDRDGRVIIYSVSGTPQGEISPLEKWRRDNGQG